MIARKGNGQFYTLDECDYLAGVTEDAVYLIPNAEQTEYWATPDSIDERWTRLESAYQRKN